jgi:hypothetical protein
MLCSVVRLTAVDAWMYPLREADITAGMGDTPTIFVSSELWSSVKFQAACRHEILKASSNALSVTFKGSTHTMYCDLHLLGR